MRAQAKREVEKHYRNIRAQPGFHILHAPTDGRRFLITNRDADLMVRSLQLWSWFFLSVFVASLGYFGHWSALSVVFRTQWHIKMRLFPPGRLASGHFVTRRCVKPATRPPRAWWQQLSLCYSPDEKIHHFYFVPSSAKHYTSVFCFASSASQRVSNFINSLSIASMRACSIFTWSARLR